MTTIATSKDALAQAKTRMEKAVEDFRKDLASIRTGRANVALHQMGSLTVADAMMIVVTPWDPSAAALIDKAIRTSDLGLNPATDGKVIRIPIPPLTEERRKDLVKQLHKVLENHKTAVRNIRRDIKEAIEKLEKDKKIGEDDRKRAIDELEKITQAETKKIEELSAAKEREVMELK